MNSFRVVVGTEIDRRAVLVRVRQALQAVSHKLDAGHKPDDCVSGFNRFRDALKLEVLAVRNGSKRLELLAILNNIGDVPAVCRVDGYALRGWVKQADVFLPSIISKVK